MDLEDFLHIVGDEDEARQFLRRIDLLRSNPPACRSLICRARNVHMTWVRVRQNRASHYGWRCPQCRREIGERVGSLFENANIPLTKCVALMHFWAVGLSVKHTTILVGLTKKTVIEWFLMFRAITSWWLQHHAQMLGGRGRIVEIDESLIAKRKNNRGRVIAQRWVFGGLDRATGHGFLVFVPNRTARTLLPIIRQHILPGTTIYSDCWRAYAGIPRIPVVPRYEHMTVNHSRYFRDPVTGVCTNRVENFWGRAKKKLKKMSTVPHSHRSLVSHMQEFLWRTRNGGEGTEAFNNIANHISLRYPVN